jgi:voltage-gated potassium channel
VTARLDMPGQVRRRAAKLAAVLAGVLLYGTAGYRWLSEGLSSWVDCLYMTAITITTIGFGEVVAGMEAPAARLFTLTLAFLGVGIFTYAVSSITFFATDEELRARWRRRTMEQRIRDWTDHYVLGGWSVTAEQIARELQATGRRLVIVAPAAAFAARPPPGDGAVVLEGEPSDEDALRRAGLDRAAGFFAVDEEDPANIIACLTARQCRRALRIVAAVRDPRNADKMRRAGADAVVSASSIGALRMASEMVRPTVVSFLDTMLRGTDPALRIEEITPAPRCAGTPLGDLVAFSKTDALLLVVRAGGDWSFNPPPSRPLVAGETLILMTTPDALAALRKAWCA